MAKKEQYYIFIDKQKLKAGLENSSKIIGSIRKLVDENIKINNKVVKYATLFNMLGSHKYFDNDDYYIKKTKLQRSKMINL